MVAADPKLQECVVNTLCKICENDEYNRNILKKYIDKYGDVNDPYY